MPLNIRRVCDSAAILLLVLVTASVCFGSDQGLKSLIRNDAFLCDGNIGFISFKGIKYLVSVGESEILGNAIEAKLNARKEAKLNAEEALVQFIYDVKTSSYEELQTKTITVKVAKNGKTKSLNREETENYLEIIREKGEGILKKVLSVGKWKSADKKVYFFAVSIEIPQ